MRIAVGVVVVLIISTIGGNLRAQDTAKNGMAGQIREQEMAVEAPSGQSDGRAWFKLAVLCQDAARYQDSEHAYRKAIALLKPEDPKLFADALDHMGTMYVETNRQAKAEPLERKALAIRERQNDLLGIGISHMHLSALLLGRRENASAESEADMAVSLIVPEQAHPELQTAATPEEKMTALMDLSLARCAQHDCGAAVPELKRALQIAHANYTANSVPVGMLDYLLGYVLWKSGDTTLAGEPMRRGTEELATQLGWGHPTYVRALTQYEAYLMQAGRTTEAEEVSARIDGLGRLPAPATSLRQPAPFTSLP